MARSSYRLGRRLRSGAKARLDYITYLQSGGNPKRGRVPEPNGNLKARFAYGGELRTAIREAVRLRGVMAGGGAYEAAVSIIHYLKATVDGGGSFRSALYPPHRLAGTIEYGGALALRLISPQYVKAIIGAGGTFTSALSVSKLVKATIAAGGTIVADIAEAIVPVQLKATIGAGGTMTTALKVGDDDVNAIIAAMSPTPDTTRQDEIKTLVLALKAAGIWSKLDALHLLHAHSAQAARLNWKAPGVSDLTTINTTYFTAESGYRGDATSGVGSTMGILLSPLTATTSLNFADLSGTMFVLSDDLTLRATEGADIGFWGTSPNVSVLYVNNGAGLRGQLSGTSHAVAANETRGVRALTKLGANSTLYADGTAQGTLNTGTGSINSNRFGVCGYNNSAAGTNVFGSMRELRAAGWGSALDATEHAALNAAIKAYIPYKFTYANREAETLVAAMTVEPDDTRKLQIDRMITSLKAGGVWAKLEGLYVFHAHDKQATRINWKTPGTFNLTEIGTVNFVANDYCSGASGANMYSTNYTPSVNGGVAGKFSLNDATIFSYTDDISVIATYDIGARGGTNTAELAVNLTSTNGFRASLMTNATTNSTAVATAGLRAIVKNATAAGFKREVLTDTAYSSGADTGLPTNVIGVLGSYSFATATGSTREQKAAGFGTAMTAAQLTVLNNAIETFTGYAFANVEAAAIVSAMDNVPDDTRCGKIDALVGALKSAGVWSGLEAFHMLYAHEETAARINWAYPTEKLTVIGAPVFTANSNYAGNTTGPGLLLSPGEMNAKGKMTVNNGSIFLFSTEAAIVGGAAAVGNFRASTEQVAVALSGGSSGGFAGIGNGGVSAATLPVTVLNLAGVTRLADLQTLFADGTSVSTASVATGILPAGGMGVCGRKRPLSTDQASVRKLQAALWGSAFTTTQVAAIDTAIKAFLA